MTSRGLARYSGALIGIVLATVLLTLGADPAPAQQDDPNVVYDPALFDGLDYRMIGPYRGGRSTTVTGIPQKPYTFLMGTTGGGVWITEDAGENWENISDEFFDVGSMGAVQVADSDPNVIYAGTGTADIRGNTSTGRGLYRSLDGGKTWEFMGLREAGQIARILVHPRNPELLYVAALGHPFGTNEERGVFRSSDGGESWEQVLFVSDSTGAVDLAMNPENPREIYASMWRAERKPWVIISGAEEAGVFKTSDGGDSWEKLENGLPEGPVGKIGLAVSPAEPDRVWALIEAKEPEGGVYRSDDAGESWQRVNRERRLRQRAYYYMHMHPDPQDPNTVYALNTGLYRSTDGGRTFEGISVPHGDVHHLWINPDDPEIMAVANDGGAQVTVNGGESWSTYFNQPTSEFYSVTVDNEFPYNVYGPQQDNSTMRVPSWNDGGTSPKQHWQSVGGCETGPVALHPDHPETIWAGCYGGVIDRTNLETGETRNMMVYPQLQLGQAPKDLRERFQWVSPIVVSPHDPDVVYHASQRIHRTTDGGMTWETISDDLTTDTPEHQEFGGAPITNEGTGVEVYNTVFALTVSPHTPETIWAGTDDGRVHISRDDGGTWQEITPSSMPEQGTVNRIEVSPHQEGEAWMAVYRYRMDDWRPYVFHTEDHGASWELVTDGQNGIPADHPVRVVREDPDREGLLYAGTEFGIFVSFDDGDRWQSLQLDLPATPVTDLKVHRRDLVVATQGRSFWILDDLTPLHQIDDEVAASERWLYQPRDAHRIDVNSGGWNRWPEGPPEGAVLHYYFADAPEGEVTLEFLDADGEVVRSFSGTAEEDDDDGGFGGGLSVEAGMNRFTWGLTTEGVDDVDDAVTWGYTGGATVVPGTYTARLVAGGDTLTRSFAVRPDPRLDDVTQADYRAQHDLAIAIRDTLNHVYDAIREIRSVREQLEGTAGRAEEAGHGEGLVARADSIAGALTAVEEELMQTNNESGQDPINYPPQLDNQYAYLLGFVAGPEGRPNEGARVRFDDLNAEWAELRSRLHGILEEDVAAFNQTLEERGVPGIISPTHGSHGDRG